jgi:hypothetical protein
MVRRIMTTAVVTRITISVEGQKIGGLRQEDIILEEQRHPYGADEGRKTRSVAQRLVGNLFHGISVGTRIDDGNDTCYNEYGNRVHPHEGENRYDNQRRECAYHVDLTMGKIDQFDDAIDHGVA